MNISLQADDTGEAAIQSMCTHLDMQAQDRGQAQDAHLLHGRPRALAAAAHPAGGGRQHLGLHVVLEA
eukprot:661862-Pelagomonas_calceolata.AAC.1